MIRMSSRNLLVIIKQGLSLWNLTSLTAHYILFYLSRSQLLSLPELTVDLKNNLSQPQIKIQAGSLGPNMAGVIILELCSLT